MEHRGSERNHCNLGVMILKQGLPVGIGSIKSGNRWGLFIESDYLHVESEHQITLEVTQTRTGKSGQGGFRIEALVVHKTTNGFGVEIDIESEEQADLFAQMLKNSMTPHGWYDQGLKKVANA